MDDYMAGVLNICWGMKISLKLSAIFSEKNTPSKYSIAFKYIKDLKNESVYLRLKTLILPCANVCVNIFTRQKTDKNGKTIEY